MPWLWLFIATTVKIIVVNTTFVSFTWVKIVWKLIKSTNHDLYLNISESVQDTSACQIAAHSFHVFSRNVRRRSVNSVMVGWADGWTDNPKRYASVALTRGHRFFQMVAQWEDINSVIISSASSRISVVAPDALLYNCCQIISDLQIKADPVRPACLTDAKCVRKRIWRSQISQKRLLNINTTCSNHKPRICGCWCIFVGWKKDGGNSGTMGTILPQYYDKPSI